MTKTTKLKGSVKRVYDALVAAGYEPKIQECATTTRTATEAAATVGAEVGQIVKSLVFLAGDRPILALVSGTNRVSIEKLGVLVGASIERPDATAVRSLTGFAIGGVPPIGHLQPMAVFVDRDLLQYDVVWAAAGSPYAVFAIAPADLVRLTGGATVDLAGV